MSHNLLFFIFILILFFPYSLCTAGISQWQLLQQNIGISAMHMQLLYDDRVVILDRTDFGPSNISLPHGQCRNDSKDLTLKVDCTAHSVEYDSISNTVRPLMVLTDTWCSSGATLPNGTLLQTGGYNDGDHGVRTYQPSCVGGCDWVELRDKLLARRWYATNHILPSGQSIIVGGRRSFNYEFYPKTPSSDKLYRLPFLAQTNVPNVENNLYPFLFLNVDGNLFIFANNRSILLDYNKNKVVRTYPDIPGGDPRSYPSSGSAVLLPLSNLEMGLNVVAEVLVCGGASSEAYLKAHDSHQFLQALNTCARIKINDPNPNWTIETMPMARVMNDMVVLSNGDILIINGAGSGTAGWELGRDPVLNPVIYHPNNALGFRFEIQNPTQTPRMYHSSAILLRDGRVLVGGSNPHRFDKFTDVLFPTDLTLEAFSPPYLDPTKSVLRPILDSSVSGSKIQYGQQLGVKFSIPGSFDPGSIKITMLYPPFNTHSFSMNQRLLVLTNMYPVMPTDPGHFQVNVMTPGSTNIALPGYYLLFVVNQCVPSTGIWVQLM